jgi:type II secretory pathway component PulF
MTPNATYHYSVEYGPRSKRRTERHTVIARTEASARQLLSDRHLTHVGVKITYLHTTKPDRQK